MLSPFTCLTRVAFPGFGFDGGSLYDGTLRHHHYGGRDGYHHDDFRPFAFNDERAP